MPRGGGNWQSFERLDAKPKSHVLHFETLDLFNLVLHPGGSAAGDKSNPSIALLTNGLTEENQPVLAVTRPNQEFFHGQLKYLRDYFDLRVDRLPEIHTQLGDMLSFYGAIGFLNAQRSKWTMMLLEAVDNATTTLEMRVKHHFSCPRPIDFTTKVQPVIQTPSHSSYPSGHATEAFALATMLAALMSQAENAQQGLNEQPMLYRVAERIAVNRTVAGVHFPVDSAHGALLGIAIAEVIIAHCLGGRDIVSRDVEGSAWTGAGGASSDFTLTELGRVLNANGTVHGVSPRANAPLSIAGAGKGSLLQELWSRAKGEWA
ncbi:MAG: phosphatase PAP2 family protein [Kiloniellales bacterium]